MRLALYIWPASAVQSFQEVSPAGLLGLIDQLASGSLMSPVPSTGGSTPPLNPTPQAVDWARQTSDQGVPGHVWTSIGLVEVTFSCPRLTTQSGTAVNCT